MITKIKPVVGGLSVKAKRTMMFAAQDLARYMKQADPFGDYPIIPADAFGGKEENTLFLVVDHEALPNVEDKKLDDAILIDTEGVCGVIAGTNARATLIAMYRFLRENGFHFIKPGKFGEHVPETFPGKTLSICEAAAHRHRALCLEGSIMQEALFDMIDWIPKVGFNGYFIQFFQPRAFYLGYYINYRGISLSNEEMAAITDVVRDEIAKRSLLHHAVGHGWTCQAVGLDSNSWEPYYGEVTDEQKAMMAEVNGERGLFDHRPLNTNLCYSQQKVRDKMSDAVLEYCKTHPDVDYVHIWLADWQNNCCECEECRKLRTSDYYVRMLNELDEKLEKEGLDTKIVFLMYTGLLWAPLKERFKNHKRFVLMFAPISRTYTHPLAKPETDVPAPEYILNKIPELKGVDENLALLRDWQAVSDGDTFIFDYYYCSEYVQELTNWGTAQIANKDIKAYHELGLNGLVNCMVNRAYLPTAVLIQVIAQTLWDTDKNFDDIADYTLSIQFGEGASFVRSYLEEIFACGYAEAMRGEKDIKAPEERAKMQKAVDVIRAHRDEIAAWTAKMTGNQKHEWEALYLHGELVERMFLFQLAETQEEKDAIAKEYRIYAETKVDLFKIEFDRGTYIPFGASPFPYGEQ